MTIADLGICAAIVCDSEIGRRYGMKPEGVKASLEAAIAERRGEMPAGLDAARLMAALDSQVASIVRQLRPGNAGNYLTLREGSRVATVRRLPQPALSASAFETSP